MPEIFRRKNRAHSRSKIAFVAQPRDKVSPASTGSIGIITYEIARRLVHHYDVTVFTEKHLDSPDREVCDGVRYIRINTRIDEKISYYLGRISDLVNKITHRPIQMFSSHNCFYSFYFLFYIIRAALTVRREKIEIVQVPNYIQFVSIIRFLNPRVRIVFNIQCEWLVQMRSRSARRRLRYVDAVLGCSKFITESIQNAFPQHREKCFTLYNGTASDIFVPGKRNRSIQQHYGLVEGATILYVGRITPEKGLHVLIDAMSIVLSRCPNAVLLIVGSFSFNPPLPPGAPQHMEESMFEDMKKGYRELLLEKARPLGEHVRFAGAFPPKDLPAFYRTADVFVHPALWSEPLGMTLLEAMACARAVVSTPTGGIPEIVQGGENGRLVRPNNPNALAQAITEMLESPEETVRMGRRGRQIVETQFGWDSIAGNLDAIYQGLLLPRASNVRPASRRSHPSLVL